MIKYPLTFSASASANSGIKTMWSSTAADLDPVSCTIPVAFNGLGNGYSPEDLMAMAVINCFIATFKVFAHHANLEFQKLEVNADLEINRAPSGQVGLTQLVVDVVIQGAIDLDKANLILEETRKNCLMANALKIDVKFNMRTL